MKGGPGVSLAAPAEVRSPKRSVASRILLSYVVVLSAFLATSVWSVLTFRVAATDATLLRQGYLPLALNIRDLVSSQDTWNSQLNHITDARNPADKQVWFETALSVGRPRKLAEVRRALDRALPEANRAAAVTRRELLSELAQARRLMQPDAELVRQLFESLSRGDQVRADGIRDRLVQQGIRVQRSLVGVERRVTGYVDALALEARQRESLALALLSLVIGLTLLIGILMALYARRVVAPLSQVTRRARAVAGGDLSPQPAINSGDEIGQLSSTFEAMVQAIYDARERLLASERLATIGKMAAHVTHEVRNPLSSIALNLDLLEEEIPPQNEEARSLVRAIFREVQRLSVLSDQYLSMARRKAPEMEECDVREMVTSATDFMRRDVERNHIELTVSVADSLPWVLADPAQLRQVLFNLVRNAREALSSEGNIWIWAGEEAGKVVIRVEDDGPGVSPGQRVEELFDPFYTTKDHGTGLGLAVTRQIVTAHGGQLRYREREGGGACFELTLSPIEEREVPSSPLGSGDTERTAS